MRFGDVQDTRKKEEQITKKAAGTHSFARLMEKLHDVNRGRRMATVNGVTFTI